MPDHWDEAHGTLIIINFAAIMLLHVIYWAGTQQLGDRDYIFILITQEKTT